MGRWLYLKAKKEEFADVIAKIEQIVFQQKFENAAVNLLDAVMISKDLGLKDAHELSGSISTNNKFDFSKVSNNEIKDLIKAMEKMKIGGSD